MFVKFLATVTVTGTATKRTLQMFKGSLEDLSPILLLSKRVNLEITSLALINFCPRRFKLPSGVVFPICKLSFPGIGRYQVRLKQISFCLLVEIRHEVLRKKG